MKKSYKLYWILPLVLLLTFLIMCAVNPVTGERELMLLSTQDEIALGKTTDQDIVQTYGLYEDPELNAFIDEMGKEMAKHTHRPNLPYRFKILDTPVINAFAVPGGYVYFTRGILGHFNNAAELAGVLGHELGHINARHSAQQYSRATLAQLGLGIGSVLSERFRKYAGLAQFGVSMLFLKFSRDNERQADDLGVIYSLKTGYDSNAMASFFQTLERLNPGDGHDGLPGWFSTHPNPENRINAVRQKTDELKKQKTYIVNRSEYLETLEGMIYGQDPRQGYVTENTFYHPQMRFKFPKPEKWKLNNTPQQVQMVSSDESAVILFSVSDEKSIGQAVEKFSQDSNIVVRNSEKIRVQSLPAYRLVADVTAQQGQEIRVQSYFIEKENRVYVFHGFSQQSVFSDHQPLFTGTMSGFRVLNDPRRINVKPETIKIIRTTDSTALENVFERHHVTKDRYNEMAILNGMQLTDQVQKNTLIKLVTK